MSLSPKSDLGIGAMNLGAGSQNPGTSPLVYYRLFSSGKPVSVFQCKACNNSLGHMVPDRCDRCEPLAARTVAASERKIVGYVQLADGIVMGEYMFAK